MATQQQIKKTTTTVKPAQVQNSSEGNILFTKDNYKWMLIGLVIMALGFFLMAGGKSSNPGVFTEIGRASCRERV